MGIRMVYGRILIAPMIAVLLSLSTVGFVQRIALGDGARAANDWNQGNADGKAQADLDHQNGNAYNPYCSIQHSNDYCSGYAAGYLVEWAVDNVLMTQSQQQHMTTPRPPSTTSIPSRTNPSSPRPCPPIMHCGN
jgi:hypothetical protein